MDGKSMAYNPMVQYAVAEMSLELEGIRPHADRIADDWSKGVDHGELWTAKLVAAKYHVVEGARRVVKLALDVT